MRDHYKFDKQFKKGEKGENKLDKLFQERFHIYSVPIELQKKGLDRLFIRKDDIKVFKIEYKTDFLSSHTGNAFIETCSIFRNRVCKTKGWAYTSHADYIIYYIVGDEIVYIVPTDVIKDNVNIWKDKFGEKSARNRDYVTKGVPLPLTIFEKMAIQLLSIE